MRLHPWLLLALSACRPGRGLPPEITATGVARAPREVATATAVLFWLPTVDTLQADSLGQAIGHMAQAAEDLRELFRGTDIDLVLTTGTRIWVRAEGTPRRMITLAGLDYPYGVVLVEPGYAEQILTGPVSDLRDHVVEYFGIDDTGERTPIAVNSKGRVPIAVSYRARFHR